nr:unnamed protein product [uncultured bacterium]
MAKKKDLANLVGGIIGKDKEETPVLPNNEPTGTQETDLPSEVVETLEVTPEMEDRLNALRRAKVGRPTGTGRKEPKNETRATFIVNPEQVRKIKYISLAEGRLHKDVIGDALARYIEEWESRNGIINLPKNARR